MIPFPYDIEKIKTIRHLKQINYKSLTVKEELRKNLIYCLKKQINPFQGIIGYENTVLPELQNALLAKHNIILLGLRGQAKTKIARLIANLLDEYIPIVAGSEINDDPFNPISKSAKLTIEKFGDEAPIEWIHREQRYAEKLATPDVTIADLIGDIDPIKAANMKIDFSDERIIHYGLIPRSNRGIFVINELPDLQPRIQVALFNILQEKDAQIRGFKIRFPIDVQIIFTANPEDYTNRGSIITPLKDRIESQIITHYPKNLDVAKKITKQESKLTEEQNKNIKFYSIVEDIIELIAFEARKSEYVDQKSGVSARLSIAAYELAASQAERRMILNKEDSTYVNITDIFSVIPAITGKLELVYEGEQEGPIKIAKILLGKAIKSKFCEIFPDPDQTKKSQNKNPYSQIISWFSKGNYIAFNRDMSFAERKKALNKIPFLKDIALEYSNFEKENELYLAMELIIYGLSEFSLLSKFEFDDKIEFKDILKSIFSEIKSTDDDNFDYNDEDYYR
jgi:magnesium chelatase subunit I